MLVGSLQPTLLDTCENGILKRSTFTQMWMLNSKIPKVLPNCTFRFCARISEPYINPGCESGLEIDIIKVLQQKLHFKVRSNSFIIFFVEICHFSRHFCQ